jgi:hypothetical protein
MIPLPPLDRRDLLQVVDWSIGRICAVTRSCFRSAVFMFADGWEGGFLRRSGRLWCLSCHAPAICGDFRLLIWESWVLLLGCS